jgi:hypothetical protein
MKTRSTRGTLALAAGVLTALVLVPVGVDAATDNVIIKDADSSTKAQVVSGGRLKIGDGAGPLTVDGTTGSFPVTPNNRTQAMGVLDANLQVELLSDILPDDPLYITAITVANSHDTNDSHVSLGSLEREIGDGSCLESPSQPTPLAQVIAGPNETVHLTFPTPIVVFGTGEGEGTCVMAAAGPTQPSPDWPTYITVIGYQLP